MLFRSDQVGAALERLLEVSGIKGREVYLGMANAKVVAREISLPWLPEKELRSALGFQVQEFIPMPPEDAIMDFELLDQGEVDGQKMQNLLLVAAPRQSVAAHVEAAERAGLSPLGIDFAPLAAVRATSGDDAHDAEALVDVGGHITYIALHRGTSVRLVRVLNKAGRDVTQAIARSLNVEAGIAELLKRGETDPMGIEGLDREKAREAATRAAAPLVEEIASTIEFSLRQTPDLQVSRIVMTGGGSHLEGIVELLDARLPLPVERAKVWADTFASCGADRFVTALVQDYDWSRPTPPTRETMKVIGEGLRLIDEVLSSGATHVLAQIEADPYRTAQRWTWDVLWSQLHPRWDGALLGLTFDSSWRWLAAQSRRLARMSDQFLLVDICMPMDGVLVRGRPEVGPVNMPVSYESLARIDEHVAGLPRDVPVSFIGSL